MGDLASPYSQLRIGDTSEFTVRIGQEALDSTLRAFSDCHPVHTDEAEAKRLGFESVILPGAHVIGVMIAHIGRLVGGYGRGVVDMRAHFFHPVFPNREVTISWTVKKKLWRSGRNDGYVTFDGDCTTPDRVRTTSCSVRILVAD